MPLAAPVTIAHLSAQPAHGASRPPGSGARRPRWPRRWAGPRARGSRRRGSGCPVAVTRCGGGLQACSRPSSITRATTSRGVAAAAGAFVDDDEAAGLGDAVEDQWEVEGFEGAGVDDLALDAVAGQAAAGLEGLVDADAGGDDGGVGAGAFDVARADGDLVGLASGTGPGRL